MDFIDHRSTAQFKFLTSATDEKIRINAGGDLLVGISTPFDTSGITLDATGALGVDGHITVATGATYDIGTATNKFRNLYLSGDINVAGASTSGDLTVGGSLSVTTDATVTGSLTVSTDATITNDLTVSNDATITGDLTVSTNAVIAGDLTVNGTTTTINTETLDVKDKNITLNYGGDTTSADGAGITIEDAVGAGTDATILWDGSSDTFDFSHAIDVTGTITADNNLTIQNPNAYGSIELGGVSGGFIDIKRPFSDDYDLRLIAEGDGGVINVASGELTIQRAGSDKLATTSTGIDVTGDITVSGTVDGRDVVADGTKLDTVETNADVTDTVNVTTAGALMDSEVTNLAQVKAFDSADYATAAQGSTADSALQNVVEDTTPQLGGDLASNGNDILFADNDKAIFGAGSDLQIYHDGSSNHTFIKETGSGHLYVQADNLKLQSAEGDNYAQGIEGAGFFLYHDDIEKLATTSTGIDVTGTATMDGLTVSGSVAGNYVAAFENTNSTNGFGVLAKTAHTGPSAFAFGAYAASNPLMVVRGDGRVGIGNESPAVKLDIVDTSADVQMRVYKNDGTKNTRVTVTADDSGAKIHYRDADNAGALRFNNNLGEVMRITADTTRVGIGTTAPAAPLEVQSSVAGNYVARFQNTNATTPYGVWIKEPASAASGYPSFTVTDSSGSATRLRVDSGTGNVSIGTSSPTMPLSVKAASNAYAINMHGRSDGYSELYGSSSDGSTKYAFLQTHSAQTKLYTLVNTPLLFGTNSAERMRIDSAGRVGIGTDSPTTALTVSTDGTEQFTINRADASINAGNTVGTILFTGDDPSANQTGARIQILAAENWATNAYGSHITFSNDSGGTLTERMRIDSSGDILAKTIDARIGSDVGAIEYGTSTSNSVKFFSANTERMRVDNVGNLLVGTTDANPTNNNTNSAADRGIAFSGGQGWIANTTYNETTAYFNRTGTDGTIIELIKSGTTVGSIGTQSGNPYIGGTNRGIRFDSTQIIPADMTASGSNSDNSIDIGDSGVRFKDLYLSGTANAGILNLKDANNNGQINATTSGGKLYYNAHDVHIWQRQGSEKMRLDASGNLLIGMTNDTPGLGDTDTGASFRADGASFVSRTLSDTSGSTFYVNRNTNDGNLIQFQKDGTTVGSIGVYAGDVYIGEGDTALRFNADNDLILPFNGTSGSLATRDAAIDLGASGGRFKDLYLSGNVNALNTYLGSGNEIGWGGTYSQGKPTISGSSGGINFYGAGNTSGLSATIDSSGNLLVGRTSVGTTGTGHSIRGGDSAVFARAGGEAAIFSRSDSDGEILRFDGNGSAGVGSIGVEGGDLTIGTDTQTGLHFWNNVAIRPWNITANTRADAVCDLGESNTRFKDLYLSGTAYVGSEVVIADSGTAKFAIGNSSNDFYIYSNAAGSERLRIDSSGNVGIGATSLSNKLTIDAALSHLRLQGASNANKNVSIQYNESGDYGQINCDESGVNQKDLWITGLNLKFGRNTSTERMRIDSAGRVGIGESDPDNKLDVDFSITGEGSQEGGIKIQNSHGSNNDIAPLYFGVHGGTRRTKAAIGLKREGSYGVGSLIFAVDANGDDANVSFATDEVMRLDANGKLGVGTSSPDVKVDIVDTAADVQLRVYKFDGTNNTRLTLTADDSGAKIHYRDATNGGALRFNNNAGEMARFDASSNLLVGCTSLPSASVQGTGISDYQTYSSATSTSNRKHKLFFNGNGEVGSISTDGSATAFNTSSDERLKDNIVDAPSASDDIDAIQVRSFDWKADGSHQKYGMVAQELNTVAPEAVSTPEDPEEMMGVDYSKLVPMLVKEIQSLRARVAQLETN